MWMKLYDYWDLLQINPAVLGVEEEMGGVTDENIGFMLIIVKTKY